jgi:hypothetical protein
MKKFAGPAKRTSTAERNERRAPARDQAKSDDDDGPMPDMDEFRLEMVRRIQSFLKSWRDCDQPICKRARACRGKTLPCAAKLPKPTAQQWARLRGKMFSDVQRAIAKHESERARTPAQSRT